MHEEFEKCNGPEEVLDHGGPFTQGIRVVFLKKMAKRNLSEIATSLAMAFSTQSDIYEEITSLYRGMDVILIQTQKKDREDIVRQIVDNRTKFRYEILSQEEYEKPAKPKLFHIEFDAPFCLRELIFDYLLSAGVGYQVGTQSNPLNDSAHSVLIGTHNPERAERIIKGMANYASELVEMKPVGP